jgi:hypothetical protein
VYLLDADPDLGSGLSGDELTEARRQAVVPVVELAVGRRTVDELTDTDGVHGAPLGFLLLGGLLTMDVRLAGRWCIRLIVPRDLVLIGSLEAESVPAQWGWTVIEPARVAILDQRLLVIGQRWPGVLSAILERAALQTQHALLQQAISQLPRVEDRLLALLWSVADRQGVVRADGVWVHLPVTHDKLARMIGARRPTVTLGLHALANRRLLRPDRDGWVIDRASLKALSSTHRTAHR